MSGLGFLIGYFLMYSIRAGTKTQDAFKSFLGAGGLAGGAYSAMVAKYTPPNFESSLLWGAGIYFFIAFLLGLLYSNTIISQTSILNNNQSSEPTPNPPPPKPVSDGPQTTPNRVNTFAVIMGRMLLGEDFRTPAPK